MVWRKLEAINAPVGDIPALRQIGHDTPLFVQPHQAAMDKRTKVAVDTAAILAPDRMQILGQTGHPLAKDAATIGHEHGGDGIGRKAENYDEDADAAQRDQHQPAHMPAKRLGGRDRVDRRTRRQLRCVHVGKREFSRYARQRKGRDSLPSVSSFGVD